MANFIKDPDAVLDYSVDWSDWLATDEVISTSTWAASDGITIETSGKTDTFATVWLSGGTAGVTYSLVNTITTNNTPARIDERTISIKVQER